MLQMILKKKMGNIAGSGFEFGSSSPLLPPTYGLFTSFLQKTWEKEIKDDIHCVKSSENT
jgi:hypothetical protein